MGTGERRIFRTISRIDSMSPPGVSSWMTTTSASRSMAASIVSVRYPAVVGSMTPRTSTTSTTCSSCAAAGQKGVRASAGAMKLSAILFTSPGLYPRARIWVVAAHDWRAHRAPSPLTESGVHVGTFLVVLAVASVLFALALLPSLGVAGRAVQRFSDKFVSIDTQSELAYPRFPVRSTVYAADGSVLATLFGDENRKIVRLGQINDITRKAVLAIEDTKFYEHPGVDVLGIFRAVVANIKAGGIAQGASTITQQLARNAFPSVGTERTLARKLQELKVAKRLEEEYSKDEILELYLNRVYFGRGVYGIGTAAEFYFSKRAEDLTLPEAATLAGLIAAPEKWSPATDMEAAVGRRNQVLLRMARLGWVTDVEAEQAVASPIELRLKPPRLPR